MGTKHHQMVEEGRTSQGFVVYRCPICKRRISKRYPDPRRGIEEKTYILSPGDPSALHSGGGSDFDGLALEFDAPGTEDEALLAPWRNFIQHLEGE